MYAGARFVCMVQSLSDGQFGRGGDLSVHRAQAEPVRRGGGCIRMGGPSKHLKTESASLEHARRIKLFLQLAGDVLDGCPHWAGHAAGLVAVAAAAAGTKEGGMPPCLPGQLVQYWAFGRRSP